MDDGFRPFDYLHFAKNELGGATHQLAMSGVPDASPEDLGGVHLPPTEEGVPELFERWTAQLSARYGVPADHVMHALGTSGAVFEALTALATLDPSRRTVVIEHPAYGIFESVAHFLGLGIERLERPVAQGYAIDLDRLEEACARGPLAVCLTDLHNPSGKSLPDDVADAIHAIADRHGTWVLLDEVYRDFREVGTAYRPGGRVVTVGSLTKCYGLGTGRLGWIFAPPAVTRRVDLVSEITCGVPPTPRLGLAVAGLDAADALIARSRKTARRARPVIDNWVDITDGVSWVPPDGGITGLVAVEGLTDSLAFARRLRAELDVQIVPGVFFGVEGSIRVSFGRAPAPLQHALEMLAMGIGALVR
jgi:aspartate/methionine/tyrosine aminotransferase